MCEEFYYFPNLWYSVRRDETFSNVRPDGLRKYSHYIPYFLATFSRMKKTVALPLLKVKRSGSGLGLFALSPIKKGDFIIEYTGERISEDEANRRAGQYLFTVTDDVTIDGRGRENTARYINHSCRPNAEAEKDEEELKVRIFARRNIKEGEEISYDYGKEHWEYHIKPYGCRCEKCAEKKR